MQIIGLYNWLIIGLYKPPNQKEECILKNLGGVLNNYLFKYKRIIFLGDFSLTTSIMNTLLISWRLLILKV